MSDLARRIAKLQAQRSPRSAPRLVWIEPGASYPDTIEAAANVQFVRWLRDDEEPNAGS